MLGLVYHLAEDFSISSKYAISDINSHQQKCYQLDQGFKGHHGDQSLMAFHGVELACSEDDGEDPQEKGDHQCALPGEAQ